MSEKMNLKNRVIELLSSNPGQSFKARDIAIWITQKYPEAAAAKLEKSASLDTEAQLLNQIVAEIGANRPVWEKQIPQLRTTEGVRPRLYYWSDKSEAQEVEEAEQSGDVRAASAEDIAGSDNEVRTTKVSEQDLYPFLLRFLESEY